MAKLGSLFFPEELPGQEFLVEADPKIVKRKVNNFEMGNVSEEISQLLSLCAELNRCSQSLAWLEKNIKILDIKYQGISRSFRDYSTEALAVSVQEDSLLHELTLEMSYTFKRLLAKFEENNKWLVNQKNRVSYALSGALHYLSLLQVECQLLEKSEPKYLWHELHCLYHYAEKQGLRSSQLNKEFSNVLQPCNSVVENYYRACIMSAVGGKQLSRKEVWTLFQYLWHWSNTISISKVSKLKTQQGCFSFDLNSGYKPVLSKVQEVNSTTNLRLLLINDFLKQTKEHLDDASVSGNLPNVGFFVGTEINVAIKVLQTLYKYSIDFIARSHERTPVSIRVDTVWGFVNMLKTLELDSKYNPKKEDFEAYIAKRLSAEYSMPIAWQAQNESKGGLCLETKTELNNLAKGKQLLVKAYNDGKPEKAWSFALVRWFKVVEGASQVGLKVFAGELELINYNDDEDHPLLLIGPDASGRQFIVAPKGLLKLKTNIVISLKGQPFLCNCIKTFSGVGADLVQVSFTSRY